MNLILQQALFENVRAFRNKNDGEVRYILHNGNNESDWEDVMIIPNLSNEVIDEVLAQPAVAVNGSLITSLHEMVSVARCVDGWESFPSAPIDRAEAAIAAAEAQNKEQTK